MSRAKSGCHGRALMEATIVTVAIVAVFLGSHTYLRQGLMGRLHTLSENLGDAYVPGSTERNQTLRLTQEEVVLSTLGPKPGNPSKKQITILSTAVKDETKLEGTEAVTDNFTKKAFD